jgi:hypothetical protein
MATSSSERKRGTGRSSTSCTLEDFRVTAIENVLSHRSAEALETPGLRLQPEHVPLASVEGPVYRMTVDVLVE